MAVFLTSTFSLQQERRESARGWRHIRVGLVRKEGLEPSRCYPQVPETCASTSSATFAWTGEDSRRRAKGQLPAGRLPASEMQRPGITPGPLPMPVGFAVTR